MVRGIDRRLIAIVLNVVASIAILLAAAIAAASGYLVYQKRMQPSAGSAGLQVHLEINERISRIADLMAKLGSQKGSVEGYFQLRNDAVSIFGLAADDGLTEREIIQSLKAAFPLGTAEKSLDRIYETYEQARFGYRSFIKGHEAPLSDFLNVYASLTRTNPKQRTN